MFVVPAGRTFLAARIIIKSVSQSRGQPQFEITDTFPLLLLLQNNFGRTESLSYYKTSKRLSTFLTMDKIKLYVDYILSITGYVIAWVNKTAKGIVQKLFGLNPEFVEETDQVNCYGDSIHIV